MEVVKENEFRGIEFTEEQKAMLKDRGYYVTNTYKHIPGKSLAVDGAIAGKIIYENENFKVHFTINGSGVDFCGCLWVEALYEEIKMEELDEVNIDVSKVLGELFFLNDIGINISDFFRKRTK